MKTYQIWKQNANGSETRIKGHPKFTKAMACIAFVDDLKSKTTTLDYCVKEVEMIYTTTKVTKKKEEDERDLRTYCPKCDISTIPCGGASKLAKKHKHQYCIFCDTLLELYEIKDEKQIKIETTL